MGRFAVTHLCRSADFELLEDADRPAIAQLVEHLTVTAAAIRWSLIRFRVAGCGDNAISLSCEWGGSSTQQGSVLRQGQVCIEKAALTPLGTRPAPAG